MCVITGMVISGGNRRGEAVELHTVGKGTICAVAAVGAGAV